MEELPDMGDGTDADKNAAWFNAVGDQLHEYNVECESHRERLLRIEELLGKDGGPREAELMDDFLPDGEWTDEEWNRALDKVSAELYKGRKMGNYFDLSSVDVEAVTRIVRESVPAVTEDEVEQFIDSDWPNASEHQEWLNTVSAKEIADWVASVMVNTHKSMVDPQ